MLVLRCTSSFCCWSFPNSKEYLLVLKCITVKIIQNKKAMKTNFHVDLQL